MVSQTMKSTSSPSRNLLLPSGKFNYAEALQKSVWFYETQQCGHLSGPDNRVNWRGDCHLHDGEDNGVDLTGGWHDAGDHIKFALPMSYSAGMLLWGVYENEQAYRDAGQYNQLLENVKWAVDYLIKCHTAPNEYWYQVSNKSFDHNWWGPGEVFPPDRERPSYVLTPANPGSAAVGDVAATLALASIVYKDSDPAYAAECLSHARQLYTFADTTRSDAGYTAANGMYNSWSGFWDELQWASVWLHLATGENSYLQAAENFTANLNTQGQSSDIEYQWAHCWDDKHYGALLMLAKITGKAEYHNFIQQHLDWWAVDGAKGWTPGGLAWSSMWGSLRYASNASFLAFVYADAVEDTSLQQRYRDFAISQMDYILGDNPRNFSYVIGFGAQYPQRPHHRLSHSSWSDQMSTPSYHRHTLYGALVGGPESADDNDYNDEINDYESNEVATDYNAGFTSAMAYMVKYFGGSPLSDFPSPEAPSNDEFFNMASVNNASNNYTELKILTHNHSGWPARFAKNLSFRYFFDISEVIANGGSINDISVETNYVEFDITKEIKHLEGSVYYVEVTFVNDTDIYPGGQSPNAAEVQLRISAPQGTSFWDPSNDFSFIGLNEGNTNVAKAPRIPVYENGTLVYGDTPVEDVVPPWVPQGLSASAQSPSAISLDWEDNGESDLAGYRIYRSSTSNVTQGELVGSSSVSQFTDEGLEAATTYYYVVTAFDSSGNESNISTGASAVTHNPDTLPPAAPTGLEASASGESSIVLSWNSNGEADLKSYKVYGSASAFSYPSQAEVLAVQGGTSFTENGLSAGTTRYYAVTAVDDSGNESDISTLSFATTDTEDITPPAIPSGLVASAVTASSISVDWSDNVEADLDHYVVYRGSSSSFDKASGIMVSQSNSSQLTIGGLTPQTSYYIKVCAVDIKGNESPLSTALLASTEQGGDVSAELSWYSTQTAVSTNTIGARFTIRNSGNEDLSLADLSVSYFFTKDKNVNLNFWSDHAGGAIKGSYTSFTASVEGSFVSFSGTDCDTRLDISFSSSAPVLGAGDTVEIQLRVARSDWTNFDQSNDFSFQSDNHIGLYSMGELISGMEP